MSPLEHALIAEYEAAQSLTFDYWSGHLCNELLAGVGARPVA
ncbi:MAG TPA: hypothetical protein VGJ60_36180 [Chloroflexota bacterium]